MVNSCQDRMPIIRRGWNWPVQFQKGCQEGCSRHDVFYEAKLPLKGDMVPEAARCSARLAGSLLLSWIFRSLDGYSEPMPWDMTKESVLETFHANWRCVFGSIQSPHPQRAHSFAKYFKHTVVAEMITELICFAPEICICNGNWLGFRQRICICNEKVSADISTDLSL